MLTLNLDDGGANDIVLSLFPNAAEPPARSILCRAVRSKTFFSVKGKYSLKWFVMSSLGGRWPKKLRNLDGPFEKLDPDECFPAVEDCVGEDGDSNAFSGSRTPRPLRMLIELARLFFAVCDWLVAKFP